MPPVFVELACISIKVNVNGYIFFAKPNMTGPSSLVDLSSLVQYVSDQDILKKRNSKQ